MFGRLLNPSKYQSFFLFGARGTGKSTLLKQLVEPDKFLRIDLLLPNEFDRLLRDPQSLLSQLQALPSSVELIILDEIQKVPQLLDLVHYAIEELHLKFALSGSSARKLKRGQANLLAGRALIYNLYPLTHLELADQFSLDFALNFGSLPKLFELPDNQERSLFLQSYAHTYLREEVVVEQLVRSLPPFRKFLEIAAQMNGNLINYSAIGRDVGVDDKTVKSYYQILEDTLLGFFLEPYHRSVRKTQIASPKFYLFDLGIKRALDNTLTSAIVPGTYAFGASFEHYVIAELVRLNSYRQTNFKFYYLRTQAGVEIDLIVDRPNAKTALIEIKSNQEVRGEDARHLEVISQDLPRTEAFIFSTDPRRKKIGNVWCLPWRDGIAEIGLG